MKRYIMFHKIKFVATNTGTVTKDLPAEVTSMNSNRGFSQVTHINAALNVGQNYLAMC